jgi:predicted TIM-barrel fold metal-dependent hydrolase
MRRLEERVPLLAHRSSDEYAPPRWRPVEHRVASQVAERARAAADRLGLDEPAYLDGRLGTASTLWALNEAHGERFYDVPIEATLDPTAADAVFGGHRPVIDVQTHLVRPSRTSTSAAAALFGFLRMVDADRWSEPIDHDLLAAPQWAACVFGGSETAVALLTSTPGPPGANVIDNADIAAAREILDRYAGSGRVLGHTIVHPNLGPAELDRMVEWHRDLRPAGWKVYTLWDPPEAPGEGWFLDDETCGIPFLTQVEALGPPIVCAHKGIAGPIPSATPAAASPRDVGPAAALFPGIQFVVYHSGYDVDPDREEGAHEVDPDRGVSRLVTSLRAAGIGPGANVWAELGSTWFLMLRRPREAAHVLGKLLLAVGPERILWGTDSVWYGPPQSLIDAFRAFTIPPAMQDRFGYPPLTRATKEAILGGNAERLYGIERPEPLVDRAWLDAARRELAERLA